MRATPHGHTDIISKTGGIGELNYTAHLLLRSSLHQKNAVVTGTLIFNVVYKVAMQHKTCTSVVFFNEVIVQVIKGSEVSLHHYNAHSK